VTVPPGEGQGESPGPVPVCPRHPERESYVRCQRCERPVCPECQRAAAVGVQCVDCVKEQAKTIRTPRTVFGGQAGSNRPLVTRSIIALCVLLFVLQLTVGEPITTTLEFTPPYALAEPWRFLTAAFLHSPSFLLHIFFNMYALWLLGPYLEGLLGHVRFAALYLLSAVGGSVGYFVLASPDVGADAAWLTSTVGASGAIFGIFSALLIVNRHLGRDTGGLVALIVINGALGFIPNLNIAWQAHLGGLITGALVTAVLVAAPKERRAVVQPVGLLGVSAALVALVLWKASLVPADLLLPPGF
jgi:membrane associated rhomboid family serine protease